MTKIAKPGAEPVAKPAPLEQFELETTLPYLLNRAGVQIGASFSAAIEVLGLSLSEWRVLAALVHRNGQTMSELAAHTSLELSRVSRLVSAAEQRGWINRVASATDGRAVRAELTEVGRALVAQAVPTAQLYERVALSGMTGADAVLLKRLLVRVYENIAELPVKLS